MHKNLTFSLFKILSKNMYNFGEFFASFKKGPKTVIKNILISICLLYCVGVFAVMFFAAMQSYNNLFTQAGNPDGIILLVMLIGALIILFFGFLSAASNYFGPGEEQFRSMPLSTKNIFCAKFLVSFVSDGIIGFLLFAIAVGIYGYNQGFLVKPLFYIGTIIASATISIISIFVIYFLLILALTVFPKLRKKSILTGLASFFVIIFVMGFSLFTSTNTTMEAERQIETMLPIVNNIINLLDSSAFLRFIVSCVKGNVLSILLFAAIFCLFIFVLVPLISNLYIKTLHGFSDVKTKKLSTAQAEEVVQKSVKKTSLPKALLLRDVRTILREPSFFANGPLLVILYPVIFLVSMGVGFIASGDATLSTLIEFVNNGWAEMSPEHVQMAEYIVVLVGAGMSIFIGNSSSIAATSFSREGKGLYDLKAMPIENRTIALVKVWHAFLYIGLAIIITIIALTALWLCLEVPVTPAEFGKMIFLVALLTVSVSLVLVFIDMFLDTANPKLTWETPIAAFKQNLNAVLAVFISLGVVGVFVVLAIFLPKTITGASIISVIFIVIGAPIGYGYFKYADKKIPRM